MTIEPGDWPTYWNHLEALRLAFETVRQERDEALARIAPLRAANVELLAACDNALLYLTDKAARDDMSDAGFVRYDDVCDQLHAAVARAKETDNG